MTDPRIVVVNSEIAQTGAIAADYRTQLIVDCNHSTFNRVSTYAAGGYNSVPTGSKLRKALDAAFSVPVKPAVVKVGRAKGVATYAPVGVATGSTHGFTITVLDGETLNATYVATVGETAQDVVTELKALFDLEADITAHVTLAVVGTGSAATLTITPVSANDDFTLTNFTGNSIVSGTATEVPSDTLAAILDQDPDFTFVTSTSHTASYQTAMMAAIEVLEDKLYFTSSADAANYGTWVTTAVPNSADVSAVAKFNNYTKTHVQYHHLADNYIEMARVSRFSYLEPGTTDWQYKELPGFGLAQVADGSRPLNAAELLQLKNKSASTVIRLGGLPRVGGMDGMGNRMGDGIRIESRHFVIRASHKFKELVATMFLNRNKIGMNDSDINAVGGALKSWLDTQISTPGKTAALDPVRPYIIKLPRAKDIPFEDKVSGFLNGIEVTAYADASTGKITIGFTVTFNNPSTGA